MQIKCSGLFELRLKSFANDMGRNSLGSCCTEKQSANGTCIGSCQTRFQICLKNYQAEIDTTSPCTFGAVVTPVLGDNTFNLTPSFYKSQQSDESINPIRFPFDFTWPVSINIFALVFIYVHKIFALEFLIYFPELSMRSVQQEFLSLKQKKNTNINIFTSTVYKKTTIKHK